MSKLTNTLRRFEESLDKEAERISEAIKATKKDIRESVEAYNNFEESKAAYREFFRGCLKKFKVKSPNELNESRKAKFFKYVENSWTGEELDESVIAIAMKEAVEVPDFESDDPREYQTGASGEENTDDNLKAAEAEADKETPIEEPEVDNDTLEENDDAAPEDPEVDDQTDVDVEEPEENNGD